VISWLRHFEVVARVAACLAILFFAMASLVATWRDLRAHEPQAPCMDQIVKFSDYGPVHCDDARAKLTVPEGWTWAKCTCPEKSP
jgi:hypothetical protein